MVCSNVNCKRVWISAAALLLFIFLSDFVIHGQLMKQAYMDTASLWRSEEEMGQYFPVMLLAYLLTSTFLALIFAKGYENRGWKEGLRFGLLITPIFISTYLVQYVVTPLPSNILCSWIVATVFQSLVGGVILSLTYRK